MLTAQYSHQYATDGLSFLAVSPGVGLIFSNPYSLPLEILIAVNSGFEPTLVDLGQIFRWKSGLKRSLISCKRQGWIRVESFSTFMSQGGRILGMTSTMASKSPGELGQSISSCSQALSILFTSSAGAWLLSSIVSLPSPHMARTSNGGLQTPWSWMVTNQSLGGINSKKEFPIGQSLREQQCKKKKKNKEFGSFRNSVVRSELRVSHQSPRSFSLAWPKREYKTTNPQSKNNPFFDFIPCFFTVLEISRATR